VYAAVVAAAGSESGANTSKAADHDGRTMACCSGVNRAAVARQYFGASSSILRFGQ
jgi:hypothetical protein